MMLNDISVSICLIMVWAGLFLWLILRIRKNVYSMGNVYLIGGMTALFFLQLTVILHWIGPGLTLEMKTDTSLHSYIVSFPHNFAHLSVWAFWILAILMLISNFFLMKHEGRSPRNMIGTLLGVICICGTYLLFVFSHFINRIAEGIQSPFLAGVCRILPNYFFSLLDYCECVIIGISILGWIATRKKPRYDKDYIVILGCSISKTGGLLPLLRGRTNRAIRYAWDQEIATGRPVKFVPSGGQGPDEVISEGSAMEFYLLTHGAEKYEVFAEKESRNTYENFLFSKKIIEQEQKDANIAFSTTNYHVLRSGMLARKVGIEAEGIGSNTKWYFWPNGFAREIVGIFVMTGKMHFAAAVILLFLQIVF